MMRSYKLLATAFGVGYMGKGAGSVAAAIYCVFYYFFISELPVYVAVVLTLVVIAIGVWCSNELEVEWGKDNGKIVIDEVAGMQISLLFIPVSLFTIVSAFLLFRFFDIAKPLLIKRMEKLPKGWGVMFDDILAGIYSNIVLQLLIIAYDFYTW
jgi:phosphatidylglycerophosphatase A